MKNKKFWISLSLLGLWILFLCIVAVKVRTDEIPYEPEITLIAGYSTAYTAKPDAITCTGTTVHEGICGGYGPYIGKTIILYQRLPDNTVGQMLGIFECQDTGIGTESFRKGKVIDVFREDMDGVKEWANTIYADGCQGKVWIQVVDAEG